MVYPNPAKHSINISLDDTLTENINQKNNKIGNLRFIDINGQIAYKKGVNLSDINTSVDVDKLPPGLYLVSFVYNGNEYMQKIVIQ